MPVAVVTGAGGLIGSESSSYFADRGYDVFGIENDMRATFFGADASTRPITDKLTRELDAFRPVEIDIRDRDAVHRLFRESGSSIELVVHCAAQPSHDWAATDPQTDFSINATGTLNLLEASRDHCPEAPFVFCSTNKVYGDLPNELPYEELETRWELPRSHPYYEHGIDSSMSIDQSTHSLFGVSKAAADLLVQEFGRYFDMPTASFRCGCLTGPNHAGAQLHGFLAYLMKCTATGSAYTIFGYQGKQVRDNIHSRDVVRAFDEYRKRPIPGAVFNMGGGRKSNCSMIEAIAICEQVAGRSLNWTLDETNRVGDHKWWISDTRPFQSAYPNWDLEYDVEQMLTEIFSHNADHWAAYS